MASAITAARGKYVWIFGDDDIPSANSLRTAFDTLRPDVSFYLYNMALLLPNGSSKIYLTRNDVDEYYNSGSTLWQSVGFVTATTTLSSLCFQRDLFAQETFNEFKLLSQIYSHSVGMFVMFHDKPCSVVLSPMYTYRQNTHDEEKERMSAHCVSQRVPSEYPFSVGLFKLLRRAARKTGEKMHNLLSAKEVEIRKDTWERANTCTHDFIGRFLKARYDHVRSSGISALRPSDVSMLWCRLCLAIARGSMPPGNSTHARFRCD